jgi:myo-inositol-1(or 4)-monophosphatase
VSAPTSDADIRGLLADLARGLRAHVQPLLGSHAHREHVQAGSGGDVTFAIDEEAEAWVERFLAERAPGVAYYTEDRGLVLPHGSSGHPGFPAEEIPVLLIDPIDGTRPAMAGLECCCVSVAAAPLGDGNPTMRDVSAACVAELKTDGVFVTERGAGLTANLSPNTDISRLFWTLGFRGRPALPLVQVLADLIDRSSVGGAVFDLGSATFDMTRILTGQLDGYVDVGSRMIDEVPSLRDRFEEVGDGAVLNNSPYDLAAAVLCLEEGGAVVTDAYGESLASRPLLGSGHEFQMSCVAAANHELHQGIIESLGRGFSQLGSAT